MSKLTNNRSQNNDLPKVSLVCVTYNAGKHLPQLLESIGQHKTADTELVIIDGNSTDDTLEIIGQNAHLVDFYLTEPDAGIYDAMNKAIRHTQGQWILFLGADDKLEAGYGAMVSELKEPHIIYYGNVIFYGEEYKEVFDDYLLTKTNICHQGIFYTKAVFEKYEYDLKYKVYADYHLNLRCWKDKEFRFEHLPHFVSSYAVGGFSTRVVDELFEQHRRQLYKQYIDRYTYYRYLNRTTGWFNTLKSLILNK
jgi:glycosyltransferase involved in cell wall biosynthesis